MTTAAGSLQTVPESPPSAPALRAADQGVADALTSVLSENTRRVYGAQWRLFTGWCDEVGVPRQVYLPRIASNRTLPKGALHVMTPWRTRWGINKGRTQARRTRKSDLPMRCGGFS